MERVLFANESGEEMAAEVMAPVPLPVRRPPSVVEPVPPKPTETEVVPMTLPCPFAKRTDEAREEIAKALEVAAPPAARFASERQLFPIAKQPAAIVRPELKVEVAVPV
jgi:hypothetical protein